MYTPFERAFGAAGCKTQMEMAAFLGIKQSSVASAKKTGKVPAEWLIQILRKKGVNPDWILYGTGVRYLEQKLDTQGCLEEQTATKKSLPEEYSIEELVTEIVRRVSKNISLE